MSAIQTAYMDLQAIKRFSQLNINNSTFLSTHIYSFYRDICLIIYEVIETFFKEKVEMDDRIKEIRNQVHLYTKKRGANQKIFQKILKYHIDTFGSDINNLGFYLTDGKVVGSTLYSTYIFLNTGNLPDTNRMKETESKAFNLATHVGERVSILISEIEDITGGMLYADELPSREILSEEKYLCKDINHNEIFTDNNIRNTLILRLIFSLQEICDVLWLNLTYMKKFQHQIDLDYYFQIRLTTLKTDEIMDNLLNLKKHMKQEFQHWDNYFGGKVESILDDYENNMLF
ncbi:hypothetical protein [Virgibacillus siamensis]|uniref:hypothetical protein n=1 Tax=Virgibacillus siamensis TaxID=480071 RepID=UPI0011158AB9|nr:hypothetical protein [Virgibacillus siamensis]